MFIWFSFGAATNCVCFFFFLGLHNHFEKFPLIAFYCVKTSTQYYSEKKKNLNCIKIKCSIDITYLVRIFNFCYFSSCFFFLFSVRWPHLEILSYEIVTLFTTTKKKRCMMETWKLDLFLARARERESTLSFQNMSQGSFSCVCKIVDASSQLDFPSKYSNSKEWPKLSIKITDFNRHLDLFDRQKKKKAPSNIFASHKWLISMQKTYKYTESAMATSQRLLNERGFFLHTSQSFLIVQQILNEVDYRLKSFCFFFFNILHSCIEIIRSLKWLSPCSSELERKR